MGATMEFDGLGTLLDDLNRMSGETEKIIDDALQAGAKPILNDAKNTRAFKDVSGDLRKSLSVSKAKKTKAGNKYVLVGTLDSKVFYGRMVEFGTSRANARPFLRPAFERNKAEATEIIIKHLKEAIERGLQNSN